MKLAEFTLQIKKTEKTMFTSHQFANASIMEQLHSAIAKKDFATVKRLVTVEKADLFGFSYDRNALHNASVYGNTDILQFLLDNGSAKDINARTSDFHLTPLMLSSEKGHTGAVKLLLQYGADRSLVSVHKKSAADFAREKRHEEILQLLLAGGGNTPLSLLSSSEASATVVTPTQQIKVDPIQKLLAQEVNDLKQRLALLERQYHELSARLDSKADCVPPMATTNTESITGKSQLVSPKVNEEKAPSVEQALELLTKAINQETAKSAQTVQEYRSAQSKMHQVLVAVAQLSQQLTNSLQ